MFTGEKEGGSQYLRWKRVLVRSAEIIQEVDLVSAGMSRLDLSQTRLFKRADVACMGSGDCEE